MKIMKRIFVTILLLLFAAPVAAQEVNMEFVRAKVQSVEETDRNLPAGRQAGETKQSVMLKLVSGPDKNQNVEIENSVIGNRDDLRIIEGEKVVLQRFTRPDGTVDYFFQEKYRIPSLIFLLILFFILGALIGGRKGVSSIIGLLVSIAFIVFLIIPLILKGTSPLLVTIIGSLLIACSTIYVAHGINRRTTLALTAVLFTLVFAVILAILAVYFSNLFGLGSEESVFLQFDSTSQINLRGVLLSGIIIGALGVLDDIATTQVAAIDELKRANPKYEFHNLYKSGISIGREHVAAMINTLALAYIGASLPLFLLFYINKDVPAWVTFNSAFLAEEIVRTLVGSAALLLAVPISTWLAAKAFSKK